MRDILNLQALKHSKHRKHNSIYDKAQRIMQSEFETEELSDEEILEIASRFPQLDVRVLIGGDVVIKSKKDTWIVRDEVRFLTLYHKAIVLNKGRVKDKYHVQDIFYDFEFIFASIISHDDYALGIRSRTCEDIKDIIEQSK
jgi:hypothetical protein